MPSVKYFDGQLVKLGDRVGMPNDTGGVVMALIETREYSGDFREQDWSYLEHGALIKFPLYGLFHYDELEDEEDMVLIARKEADGPG